MNQILALDNPQRVDMLLNQTKLHSLSAPPQSQPYVFIYPIIYKVKNIFCFISKTVLVYLTRIIYLNL